MNMDIVIPVKASLINEELRYTLRSICANFPHDKVWIVGYKPPWLNGDINFVPGNNAVGSKYLKVVANHLATMKHPAISDDFYLFNDDFFVLRPVHFFKDYHRGPITENIAWREKAHGPSMYLNSLKTTHDILRRMGFDNPMDFGLHIPMKINKKNWLKAWHAQQRYNLSNDIVHMRTIYGNLFSGDLEKTNDVKITTLDKEPGPDWTYVSTIDSSFISGAVGAYIRTRFDKMCKCEGAVSNMFMLQ